MERKISEPPTISSVSTKHRRKQDVNLYAYKCNGHTNIRLDDMEKFDYGSFFNFIIENEGFAVEKIISAEEAEYLIITSVLRFDNIVLIQVAESNGDRATALDKKTKKVITVEAGQNLDFANEVWIAVDLQAPRYIAIQRKFKGNGVPMSSITRLFEEVAKSFYGKHASLTFEPQISESFSREIDNLDRITKASIRINRPNYDWRVLDSVLDSVGDESNAGSIEVQAVSHRGESLDKNSGLVLDAKNLHRIPVDGIESAKVSGYEYGNSNLKTVSSKKNTISERIPIISDNINSFTSILAESAGRFIDSFRNRL